MNTRTLGVALVFITGCAVGGASARFVVPPASAQQAATLTKWEYTCWLQGERIDLRPEPLNQLGAQGWELAGQNDNYWCFKRPKM